MCTCASTSSRRVRALRHRRHVQHGFKPITDQMEHKLIMLLHFEREERDDGMRLQGHKARYMHKTRMSIVREDSVREDTAATRSTWTQRRV